MNVQVQLEIIPFPTLLSVKTYDQTDPVCNLFVRNANGFRRAVERIVLTMIKK